MTKVINTIQGKGIEIPIWFLRQAGRYLPEYMEVRREAGDFLALCYDSEKSAKVTMQPIDRFDMDAAIVFADILLLPDVLGWDVTFKKGEGPCLRKLKSEKDLTTLDRNFDSKIQNVYDTVSKVRAKLNKDKSLIGFAGSPWTVASYMIEGRGKHDFSVSKNFVYNNKETTKKLIEILSFKTIEYLSSQILAGADVIMLFDSWSGVLSGEEYENLVIQPTRLITKILKSKYPHIPIIGFPRASGYNYDKYIHNTGIDVVSVDQFVPPEIMAKWQEKIVVQGNFDPVALLGSEELIKDKVDSIFAKIKNKNFIFNLGHGILPNTNPENVEFLVNYVRQKSSCSSF